MYIHIHYTFFQFDLNFFPVCDTRVNFLVLLSLLPVFKCCLFYCLSFCFRWLNYVLDVYNMTVEPWPALINKRSLVRLSGLFHVSTPAGCVHIKQRHIHIPFSLEGVSDSAKVHICLVVFTAIPIYPCPWHPPVSTCVETLTPLTVNGCVHTHPPLHSTGFAWTARGYSRVTGVLLGVMTREIRLSHSAKVRVLSSLISSWWEREETILGNLGVAKQLYSLLFSEHWTHLNCSL